MLQKQSEVPGQSTPQGLTAAANTCGRQTGKAVLQDILFRLERRYKHVKTLLAMLPTELNPEQDDALWQIACEIERR